MLGALGAHTGATLLLTTPELSGRAGAAAGAGVRSVVVAGDDGPAAEPVDVAPEDVAYLQATSGSTGGARAVALTHAALLASLRLQERLLPFGPEAVLVSWLALSHDMGFVAPVLQPLFSATRTVLLSPLAFLVRPARWLEAITRHRGTIAGGPNFGYELVARRTTFDERERLDLSSWRCAVNGAEPIDPATLERFSRAFAPVGFRDAAFTAAYGLAEATSTVTTGAVDAPPVLVAADAERLREGVLEPVDPGAPGARVLVGNGTTDEDHELRIAGPDGAPLEPGRIGELWVRGPAVAAAYGDGATDGFGAVAADGSDGWLRTGDEAVVHDGELLVTGRAKDVIIVRGRNHAPHDVERSARAAHPDLEEGLAAAFGVPDALLGEAVVVAVEAARGSAAPVAELAAAVRARVAEEHGLEVATVVVLAPAALPRTSSGKVRRRPIAEAFAGGTLEHVLGRDDRRSEGA
jgi:acyl-CoA synthetase (AMP-forming)/AMP-acid ligase II